MYVIFQKGQIMLIFASEDQNKTTGIQILLYFTLFFSELPNPKLSLFWILLVSLKTCRHQPCQHLENVLSR